MTLVRISLFLDLCFKVFFWVKHHDAWTTNFQIIMGRFKSLQNNLFRHLFYKVINWMLNIAPSTWKEQISGIFLYWLHLSDHNKISKKNKIIYIFASTLWLWRRQMLMFPSIQFPDFSPPVKKRQITRLPLPPSPPLVPIFPGFIEQWRKTTGAHHFSQTKSENLILIILLYTCST